MQVTAGIVAGLLTLAPSPAPVDSPRTVSVADLASITAGPFQSAPFQFADEIRAAPSGDGPGATFAGVHTQNLDTGQGSAAQVSTSIQMFVDLKLATPGGGAAHIAVPISIRQDF